METRELLTTIGIAMPADFDKAAYERAWKSIASLPSSDGRTEAGFGWNAVAYRCRHMCEADELFERSVTEDGDAPEPEARFRQESLLFQFFLSGQASVESFCYAAYAVGSILQPPNFPMANLRAITVRSTMLGFKKAFPLHPLSSSLRRMLKDPTWCEWNDLRNVLAHRSAPGRHISRTIGDVPSPTVWKVEGLLEIHAKLTAERRRWLVDSLNQVMTEFADLLETESRT